ncbi:hypothetical protein CsSME_00052469 [Camellia sinensis var. sinensis]
MRSTQVMELNMRSTQSKHAVYAGNGIKHAIYAIKTCGLRSMKRIRGGTFFARIERCLQKLWPEVNSKVHVSKV